MGRSHTTKAGFQIDADTLFGCCITSFDWSSKHQFETPLKPKASRYGSRQNLSRLGFIIIII